MVSSTTTSTTTSNTTTSTIASNKIAPTTDDDSNVTPVTTTSVTMTSPQVAIRISRPGIEIDRTFSCTDLDCAFEREDQILCAFMCIFIFFASIIIILVESGVINA